MNQGRSLGGARVHYDFLLNAMKDVMVLCCKVAKQFTKNNFSDAPLVHSLKYNYKILD